MNEEKVSKQVGADALFTQYVDVVNRVFGQNRDRLYGKGVELYEKIYGDKPVAIGVFKSDASSPHHWYTIKLSDGTFEVLEHGKRHDATVAWKVSEKHLAHVVDNPKKYIEHPLELDLDWLKTRVGAG